MSDRTSRPCVIVIGAGYAGVLAANRLARHATVTVVDPRAATVDRIRLHQVAAGTRAAERVQRPLRDALHPSIRHERARALAVEPGPGGVAVATDAGDLRADAVVLAFGRGAAREPHDADDAAAGGAHAIDTLEGALALRDALAELGDGSRVQIIGAGLTGVELAGELASARPELRVALVARDGIGIDLAEPARRALGSALRDAGVRIRDTPAAADLTVRAVGPAAERLAAAGPWRLHGDRVAVDDRLRVLGADARPIPGLWAAGDVAAVPDCPWLGDGCATAEPMAAAVADAIMREHGGRAPKRASIGYAFRLISVGRRRAVVQLLRPDGSPKRTWLRGAPAVLLKEAVSRLAAAAPVRFSRIYRPMAGPR